MENESLYSEDTLYGGELRCRQHLRGYRFSLDALLVSHYQRPKKGARVLDLGCGSGVIALSMAYRFAHMDISLVGFERQHALAELARANISLNGYGEICTIVEGDARNILEHLAPESFQQVVCNPPFFALGSGRTSQNDEAYHARHQVAGDIGDFLYAASRVLVNKGYGVFIYPASSFVDFCEKARKYRLEPKRVRYIYNYPEGESEARLFLALCQKNGGTGLKVERPFYVYNEKNGDYHQEMEALYQPR